MFQKKEKKTEEEKEENRGKSSMDLVDLMQVLKPFIFSPIFGLVAYSIYKSLSKVFSYSITGVSAWKIWGIFSLFFLSLYLGYKQPVWVFKNNGNLLHMIIYSIILGIVWEFLLLAFLKASSKRKIKVNRWNLFGTLVGLAFIISVFLK